MLEDKLLVWKLKHGNVNALQRIYEKYKNDLLALAIALLNDKNFAEDAVHDVFVSFARFTEKLQLRSSLRSYLLALYNENEPIQLINITGMNHLNDPGTFAEISCEILLKNGEIKKMNLAIRKDNQVKRYEVDGGV